MLGRTAGNGSAAGRRAVFAGAPGGVRAPPAGVRAPPAGRAMGRPPGRGQRGVAQREEEGGCAGDGRAVESGVPNAPRLWECSGCVVLVNA